MAESWLRSYPISAPDPVPWGWNPAATFQTAFNDAQENQRAQEEMQMKAELSRILFPQKQAEVEFNLKKLAYESENLTNAYKLQSEMIDERRRIIRTGGSGASSNVAGNGGSSNQAPAQDEDPTSFNLTGTSYDRKSAAQSQPGSQPIAKKPAVDLTGV
jgi:hypothetical protein